MPKTKPKKKVSEAKLRELGVKAITEFQGEADKRFDQAMAVYNEQDADTQDALDRMIDLLCAIARRRMWIAASKGSDQRIAVDIPDEAVRKNMTYMAVEIMKDLGQMDVKIANFTFPKNLCAVCSKPIKKGKK